MPGAGRGDTVPSRPDANGLARRGNGVAGNLRSAARRAQRVRVAACRCVFVRSLVGRLR